MTSIIHNGKKCQAFLAELTFCDHGAHATVKVCLPDGTECWEEIGYEPECRLRDNKGNLYPAAEDMICRDAVEQAVNAMLGQKRKACVPATALSLGDGALWAAMFSRSDVMGEAFLDSETGAVIYENDEDVGGEAPPKDINENARYIPIPPEETNAAWQRMREFAESREDGSVRERLLNAIEGAGSFRYFRDIVRQDETLNGEWAEFEEVNQRAALLDWCKECGVTVAGMPDKG